jgi:hypothetical protein
MAQTWMFNVHFSTSAFSLHPLALLGALCLVQRQSALFSVIQR